MERKAFDMNQCEFGDILVSKHGRKFMYLDKREDVDPKRDPYLHHVAYFDDYDNVVCIGTRTDEGWVFKNKPVEEDHDIVGFWGCDEKTY